MELNIDFENPKEIEKKVIWLANEKTQEIVHSMVNDLRKAMGLPEQPFYGVLESEVIE